MAFCYATDTPYNTLKWNFFFQNSLYRAQISRASYFNFNAFGGFFYVGSQNVYVSVLDLALFNIMINDFNKTLDFADDTEPEWVGEGIAKCLGYDSNQKDHNQLEHWVGWG